MIIIYIFKGTDHMMQTVIMHIKTRRKVTKNAIRAMFYICADDYTIKNCLKTFLVKIATLYIT